jgi:hypothetical protein
MSKFKEEIELRDYFKSRDVILDFNRKQIIKMSELINNQKDRIEQLESENSLFRFVFENKSLDNLGIIAPESKDDISHKEQLINDKVLEIDALKAIINDLRNYLHNVEKENAELIKKNYALIHKCQVLEKKCEQPIKLYKGIILDEESTLKIEKTNLTCPSGSTKDFNFRFLSECPDVKESYEYKKIEEKFKNSLGRIEGLGHVICDRDAEIKKQQDFIWLLNSKKSEYIDKYLYLKEQIQLVMDASPIQRLNRKNLKGISYDEIKLEPEE